MITRYNYKHEKPVLISTPDKTEFELITLIEPISFNEDKTVKEYKEIQKWVEKKSKWQDFIDSFNLGTISEQVISHIERGTPLVTAHTLPAGDYRDESLVKGAEILREMAAKGITLEMLAVAANSSSQKVNEEVVTTSSESEAE